MKLVEYEYEIYETTDFFVAGVTIKRLYKKEPDYEIILIRKADGFLLRQGRIEKPVYTDYCQMRDWLPNRQFNRDNFKKIKIEQYREWEVASGLGTLLEHNHEPTKYFVFRAGLKLIGFEHHTIPGFYDMLVNTGGNVLICMSTDIVFTIVDMTEYWDFKDKKLRVSEQELMQDFCYAICDEETITIKSGENHE